MSVSTAESASAENRGQDLDTARRIAVLPLLNRSAGPAPLETIRESLIARLSASGLLLVGEDELAQFMRRHRMRYTGGLDADLASRLRAETSARAVLITTVDLYRRADPPMAGLSSRLVSTDPEPRILWMDSAVLSGDQAPGLLGLGLIDDVEVVLGTITDRVADSLIERAMRAGGERRPERRPPGKKGGRFRPKVAYSSPDVPLLEGRPGGVAVLPFANRSRTRYAGEIVSDQLVRHLAESGFEVVEPGVVRQVLLDARLIQPQGPSSLQVDILRRLLEVPTVLAGEVAEYLGPRGGANHPVIDFSLHMIDTASRQVIWSSISHTTGGDGVVFFDAGRIDTIPALASKMTEAVVAELARAGRDKAGKDKGSDQQDDVDADEVDLALLADDPDHLRRLVDSLETARRELEKELAAARALIQTLSEGGDEAGSRLMEARELEQGLRDQIAERTREAEALATSVARLEEREAMLRDSIDSLEELLTDERRQLSDAQRELADALERARKAEAEVAALEPRAPSEPGFGDAETAVREWARAWQEQRVDDYLSSYAADFQPVGGVSRDDWEALRRTRVSKPRFIELTIEGLRIEEVGANRVRAHFRQTYRSDTYADATEKTLDLVRQEEQWLILAERGR